MQERVVSRQRRDQIANPEKHRARAAVHDAVKSGRLTRDVCSMCGTGEGVEAHHDDYSQPLAVKWLCVSCHNRHHVEQRQALNAARYPVRVPMPDIHDDMTIPQAAEALGIDPSVVLRAVQRGRIPARRMGSKLWIVKRDDVEAYRMTRREGPPRGRRGTGEQP